jgi:hypothetical protein
MEKYSLSAVAITEDTVSATRMQGGSCLWEIARTSSSMIFMSPEQLSSNGFGRLLDNDFFTSRLVGLGCDEAHLIDSWGKLFRKSFRNIGLVRARMPTHVVLVAVTGTLLAGDQERRVCKSLGLLGDSFFTLRRSNLRSDIRTQFITLLHGLGGHDFPSLKPLLSDERKCIVFCPTIRLAFNVLCYLWHNSPPFPPRDARFFLYNAINSPEQNAHIRKQMRTSPLAQVIIATDALHVGVSIDCIRDVHVLGLDNLDLNKFLQMIGRAARGKGISDARGILHLPKTAAEKAQKAIEASQSGSKKSASAKGGKIEPQMDLALAHMILAPCKTVEQRRLYDNPPPVQCCCRSCAQQSSQLDLAECACSGCKPVELDQPAKTTTKRAVIPKSRRLDVDERAVVTDALRNFRLSMWRDLPSSSQLPPTAFLSDRVISSFISEWFNLEASTGQIFERAPSPYLQNERCREKFLSLISELQTRISQQRLMREDVKSVKLTTKSLNKDNKKAASSTQGGRSNKQGTSRVASSCQYADGMSDKLQASKQTTPDTRAGSSFKFVYENSISGLTTAELGHQLSEVELGGGVSDDLALRGQDQSRAAEMPAFEFNFIYEDPSLHNVLAPVASNCPSSRKAGKRALLRTPQSESSPRVKRHRSVSIRAVEDQNEFD